MLDIGSSTRKRQMNTANLDVRNKKLNILGFLALLKTNDTMFVGNKKKCGHLDLVEYECTQQKLANVATFFIWVYYNYLCLIREAEKKVIFLMAGHIMHTAPHQWPLERWKKGYNKSFSLMVWPFTPPPPLNGTAIKIFYWLPLPNLTFESSSAIQRIVVTSSFMLQLAG